MSGTVRRGAVAGGGALSYPSAQLYEEVAFIAFYFHWSPDAILNLDHRDRQRWVEEISKINKRL